MPKGPYYQSCAGCSLENGAPGHCSLVCQSCMGNGYLVTQTISAGDPRTATSAHSSNGQIIGRLTKFRIDMRDCPYNLVQDVDGKLECFEDIPPSPAPLSKQSKNKGEGRGRNRSPRYPNANAKNGEGGSKSTDRR